MVLLCSAPVSALCHKEACVRHLVILACWCRRCADVMAAARSASPAGALCRARAGTSRAPLEVMPAWGIRGGAGGCRAVDRHAAAAGTGAAAPLLSLRSHPPRNLCIGLQPPLLQQPPCHAAISCRARSSKQPTGHRTHAARPSQHNVSFNMTSGS